MWTRVVALLCVIVSTVVCSGPLKSYYVVEDYTKTTRSHLVGFTPREVYETYQISVPPPIRRKVAIIELGGGYNDNDLIIAWNNMGFAPIDYPTVTWISVNGAVNSPGVSHDDFEVAFNIQIVGAIRNVDIFVLFAPNSFQGFYDAFVVATNGTFDSVSVSWGADEQDWNAFNALQYELLFEDAANRGVSIFVSSGNSGANLGVIFPGSAPHVISCGGTTLISPHHSYTALGTSETGWSLSTGGYSALFSGRAVPDVASTANPSHGILIYISTIYDSPAGYYMIGGTSGASPLWTGVWSVYGSGYAKPQLYADFMGLHDIVSGNNGYYTCQLGYDLVTGLGSPNPLRVPTLSGEGLPLFISGPFVALLLIASVLVIN
jgi:kumamolisin